MKLELLNKSMISSFKKTNDALVEKVNMLNKQIIQMPSIIKKCIDDNNFAQVEHKMKKEEEVKFDLQIPDSTFDETPTKDSKSPVGKQGMK